MRKLPNGSAKVFSVWRRIRGSPAFFAAIYLAAIPAFATLYQNIWYDLQQSTSADDAATFALEEQLLRSVTPAIKQILDRDREAFEGALSDAAVVSGPDFDKEQRTASFVWAIMAWAAGAPDVPRQALITISSSANEVTSRNGWSNVYVSIDVGGVERAARLRSSLRMESHGPLQLIPPSADQEKSSILEGWLHLPNSVVQELDYYISAHRGHPAPAPGGFGRYLYFSVVTITTLGYGDIIPLTDRARLWVGAESLFGVVVAGLFINAVATKKNRDG